MSVGTHIARWLLVAVGLAALACAGYSMMGAEGSRAQPMPPQGALQGLPLSRVGEGALQVAPKPGAPRRRFPLEHTQVEAEIAGMVAHVRVTQRFANLYQEPIEALYVFPLPENAAVNNMIIEVGGRTIRGIVKPREEARQIYEQAKAAGKRAGLLEQERPNIFTQSVANILPGERILVTIEYVQDLRHDDGSYEFVFPMVVGPRYIPGTPTGKRAGGWAPDTDQVPDASRITPPVLKPGERSGHDIALRVRLDAGVPIRHLRSVSHEIEVKRSGDTKAEVSIAPADRIPNKDFILRYNVLGDRPEMGLLTHRAANDGFFMLMIQPKRTYQAAEITPKEVIFVVDCSGSMSGEPIAKAKQAIRRFLKGLQPEDSFQIIRFSVTASGLSPRALPATQANIERGLSYVDGLSGQGGTEMIQGIKAALDYPPDPKRLRIVAFMTDGYIGNETTILAAIEDKRRDARLFAFGVGTSVNRYLLEGMARAGRGGVQYVRPDEDTTEVVERFYERISTPYLTDLAIDWKNLAVRDTEPAEIPDLFAGQPVIIKGRYDQPGQAMITLRARLAGKPWSQTLAVALPPSQPDNRALASLWARTRVRTLTDTMWRDENPEVVKQVTNLALQFSLMSPYTSFVAVEEKVITEGGKPQTVQVPVPMPEGVSYEGVFGDVRAQGAYSGPAVAFAPQASAGRPAPPAAMPAPPPPAAATRSKLAYSDEIAGPGGSWIWSLNHVGQRPEAISALQALIQEADAVIATPGIAPIGGLHPQYLRDMREETAPKVLFVSGAGNPAWPQADYAALAARLRSGGFLIVDSTDSATHESIAAGLRQALPGAELKEVAPSHPLFVGAHLPHRIADAAAVTPLARGLFLDGQLVALFSRWQLTDAWAAGRTPQTDRAYRVGINLLSYALQR